MKEERDVFETTDRAKSVGFLINKIVLEAVRVNPRTWARAKQHARKISVFFRLYTHTHTPYIIYTREQ